MNKLPSSAIFYDYIGKVPPDEEALSFFSTIAYTKKYLTNPDLQDVPFCTRLPKHDGADAFFSQTLNTGSTVEHALLLVRRDIVDLRHDPSSSSSASSSTPDVVALFQLGHGLAGHPGAIHGGMLASLLDEVVGINTDGSMRCAEVRDAHPDGVPGRIYTAYLNTSYYRPAPPGVYVVESRLERRDGRKWFFAAHIIGADGVVYTGAEVLFIKARPSAM